MKAQNITTYNDNKSMLVYILLIDRKPHSIYTDSSEANEALKTLEAIFGFDKVVMQENAITYND